MFIGPKATEKSARYYGQYAGILHFACHGGFSQSHPLYSSLELRKDADHDGFLEVHEIFQLQLQPAYLVTLSACETGRGGLERGDELTGLSRAFIYAGTPSILASLWKVDDYHTSQFIMLFYKALKKSNKIEALYRARKELMEKHKKRHPYYWSVFILIGDYR